MLRLLLCCYCICLLTVIHVVPLQAAPAKSPPLVEARSYRAKLQQAEDAFGRIERGAARTGAAGIVQGLSTPPEFKLRRSDGETIDANNYEWQRRSANLQKKKVSSRATARDLRLAANRRRLEVEAWMNGRDGQMYEAADAQDIMRQLESTGQIRTGPTPWQKMWTDLTKRIGQGLTKMLETIAGWLNGGGQTTPRAPDIDPRWIKFLFYSTVLSLLAVLGYLLWRTLGGRLGREGARREVRYLQGEDAELLLLPPDELRQRADRFAADGNFRQALRHLYLSLLLQLDNCGIWRYDTRRTNWEHIRGLRRTPQGAALIEPLADITRRFDRVRYGDQPCSAQDWTRFADDVEGVQQLANGNNAHATASAMAEAGSATGAGARS